MAGCKALLLCSIALCCSGFKLPSRHLARAPRRPAQPRVPLTVRGGALFDGGDSIEAVRALTSTPLGSLAYIAAYVTVEMCGIPSIPLAAAAGVIYPVPAALALVLGSSTAAACMAFQIGRTKLRPKLEARIRTDPKLGAIDAAVRENGFTLLLLLRLVPMPPAINYVYGAIKPSWAAYVGATLIGYIPGTVMTVFAAAGARGPLLGGAKLPWYGYAAGGALVAAIVGLLAKLAANVKATLDEYEKRMS